MKNIFFISLFLINGCIAKNNPGTQIEIKNNLVNKKNYVADDSTAIKIAEAIWLPIFGKIIYDEKPFRVSLDTIAGVWKIQGTTKFDKGGEAYIEIQMSDGRILKVLHDK